MKDIEVASPPDDSISCLEFSPPSMPGNFLIAGSWANDVMFVVLFCFCRYFFIKNFNLVFFYIVL